MHSVIMKSILALVQDTPKILHANIFEDRGKKCQLKYQSKIIYQVKIKTQLLQVFRLKEDKHKHIPCILKDILPSGKNSNQKLLIFFTPVDNVRKKCGNKDCSSGLVAEILIQSSQESSIVQTLYKCLNLICFVPNIISSNAACHEHKLFVP